MMKSEFLKSKWKEREMSVEILNRMVYEANFLKEKVPTYFIGCSTSIGKIIEKKKIPEDKYMWCSYHKKNGYTIVDPKKVNKRKLYINKEWVDDNVPGFGHNDEELEISSAPPLLELTEYEKLRDENNEVLDIEVRGERHVDKVFFKARDVEKSLKLKDCNIHETLSNKDSTFELKKHYTFFIPKDSKNLGSVSDKKQNQKTTFLTYHGLVKLLFTRRHPIAEHFQKWAIDILFVHQFGTQEQKEHLGADLLGVDVKTLKNVLDCSVDDFPCVYLFYLGTAKDTRNTIPNELSDDTLIFKYGYTKNLKSRLENHIKTFGKHIQLKWHVIVDPYYLSKAETDLKKAMEGYIIEHPKYDEIVGIKEKVVNSTIHHIYKNIGKHYAGRLKEIQHQMEKLRLEKDFEIRHSEEMRQKDEKHFQEILKQKDDIIDLHKELLEAYRQKKE